MMMRELTFAQAGLEAVAEEMRRDPKIFYMSTDAIGPLVKEFGPTRMRATPITEAALTGIAIGAAGSGYRPIMDWRQITFSFVAMDQIVNQAAKIHYMFGGQRTFHSLPRQRRRRHAAGGPALPVPVVDVHEPVGPEVDPAVDARRSQRTFEVGDPRQ